MQKTKKFILCLPILFFLFISFLFGIHLYEYQIFSYQPETGTAVAYASLINNRTDLWYENWEGNGHLDATSLNAILEQSTYSPLSRKEGMKIIWRASKSNTVCSITGKSVLAEEMRKGTERIFIDLQVVFLQDQIYLIVGNQVKVSEGDQYGPEYNYANTVYRADAPGNLHGIYSYHSSEKPQRMGWLETGWFLLKYSFPLQISLLAITAFLLVACMVVGIRRKAGH